MIGEDEGIRRMDRQAYPPGCGRAVDGAYFRIQTRAAGGIGLPIGEAREVVIGVTRQVGLAIGLVTGIVQDGDAQRAAEIPFVMLTGSERDLDLRDPAFGANVILL